MKLFKKGFNSKSRTENVLRNMNVALICQIFQTLLGFVSRTFFISMLGKTYLGVNGVFSNILTFLNFAELGIGTAIVYNLYRPLHEKDESKVSELINFYRNAYLGIAAVISAVGLALIPFLRYLIKEQPDIKENITLLYVLYLTGTVASYFNAHKKSLLIADQKQYITNITYQTGKILLTIFQIVFLYFTRNYIIYLCLQILFGVGENIIVAKLADSIYPFLKKNKNKRVDNALKASIKKDVGALSIYKINSAVWHGTDNILLAAIVNNGVQVVGLYSNYLLLSEALNMLLGIVTNALTPSTGNLNVETDIKKKERVFYTFLFLSSWLYGFACSGLFTLSGSFISNWIGSEYLLGTEIVFAIVLQMYIVGVHFAAFTYRETCGLFVQSKYVPIAASVINIGLSIYWGKIWGVFGILFATSIARIFTIGISDPVLVYKHVFKKSPIIYYLRYAIYTAVVILCHLAASWVVGFIHIDGWLGFLVSGLVFSLVFNAIFVLCTFKTEPFSYLKNQMFSYLKRFARKKKQKAN